MQIDNKMDNKIDNKIENIHPECDKLLKKKCLLACLELISNTNTPLNAHKIRELTGLSTTAESNFVQGMLDNNFFDITKKKKRMSFFLTFSGKAFLNQLKCIEILRKLSTKDISPDEVDLYKEELQKNIEYSQKMLVDIEKAAKAVKLSKFFDL